MTAIRNQDGKVVCHLDEETGAIEIKLKGCKTVIRYSQAGKPEIRHINPKDTR
jgi:hypothetical protein